LPAFTAPADETQKQFIHALILAGEKQVVNNRLAIHPTLNQRLERGASRRVS